MKNRMAFYSGKRGVSLLIAVIFVSAFMLVIGTLYGATHRVIKGIRNRETAAKADYLARSAFELASYWANTHKDGQNLEDFKDDKEKLFSVLYDAAADLGISSCKNDKCSGFDVAGRADNDDVAKKVRVQLDNGTDWFSVPVRGTGDAGTCKVAADSQDANHGCNWNMLRVGQSVTIPLYYVDKDGTVVTLKDEFKLRMRSPCKDAEDADCTSGKKADRRVALYPRVTTLFNRSFPFRNINKDTVLVQWTMEDSKNNQSIVAWDYHDKFTKLREIRDDDMNTEISGGRINDANNDISPVPLWDLGNFIVLEKKYSGKDLLTKGEYKISTFLNDVANAGGKAILRLHMIDQPRKMYDNEQADKELSDTELNDSDRYVPYIEYQLLTLINPVADSKSYISGWAEFGGFRKEIKRELKRSSSGGGFAIENF